MSKERDGHGSQNGGTKGQADIDHCCPFDKGSSDEKCGWQMKEIGG